MSPLENALRRTLEHTVESARDAAEGAARAALEQLGMGQPAAYDYLSAQDKELRRRLRVHGRQLGDVRNAKGEQELVRLIEEVAYQHWHRMLFARFLAENSLLMYRAEGDDEPIDVDLETCQGLLDEGEEQADSVWELAARFAARMLPQIFRPDSPVFGLELPPEHQQELERLVEDLPREIFSASDSIGWVYQFWQSKKKEEVNASEVKIGARELPAVTQLFTEPYMVSFLLDNSLGAWWAARRLTEADLQNASSEEELRRKAAIPGVPLDYLRFVRLPSPSGRGAGGEGNKTAIPADILNNARELRRSQTDAEQLLWSLLRDRRFADKKFRRQHPVGRYILDFYCHELQLAIELDGGQHSESNTRKYDEERTRYLNDQGIRVVRFWNNEVLQQTESVLEALWNALTPSPLPEGEGLWTPAAGTFDGWPEQIADLKTLDPCCGSGHFLVAAFLMLVPMRMKLEHLSAQEAVNAVLRENIHGLELDQRCVELAAFALALTAWKYPNAGGYRVLPELNVACSGLSVSVAKEEWKQLGLGKKNLSLALDWMHDTFKDAPVLGSLLNPAKSDAAKLVQWDELSVALDQALKAESTEKTESTEKADSNSVSSVPSVDEKREVAVVAQGLAKAATLLAGRYQWVITNVPYLARGKQDELLRDFCERHYSAAKNDLATVFLDRCLELCVQGGTSSIVLPQNWLFLTSYKKFREKLLKNDTWHLIARLGPGAFETISGEVVKAILISLSRGNPTKESGGLFGDVNDGNLIRGVDVSEPRTAAEKAAQLLTGEIKSVEQAKQLENPDNAIVLSESSLHSLLRDSADGLAGILNGDSPRLQRQFWEFNVKGEYFVYQQGTVIETIHFGGLDKVIEYDDENGHIRLPADFRRERLHDSDQRGNSAWGKWGVAVSEMRVLPSALYVGNKFDSNIGVVLPKKADIISALWCYCSDTSYNDDVRLIDQKLNVTNATLVKVPFDLDHWTKVAEEKYPNGLPKPYTDDPTQWIFHGHPCGSVIWNEETKRLEVASTLRTDDSVLQVAVARLLGYRWPAELDTSMELADEQREWVKRCEALSLTPALSQGAREISLVDDDGIVCIPPVRGEASASDRLLNLLAAAYNQLPSPSGRGAGGEGAWSNDTLAALLKSADHAGKTLETWLREKFFTQHCKLFQHRPFIWHIWDGLRDGFAALVNYHKLDAKLLETLIYTYLGDWISRQKQDIASHVDGAQERLAAAEALKKKLELILEGEAPYDIFVRWKPLEKQPIGWDPDLNDGVRLNIRPFMTIPDVKKRGAGVLRDKPNIKWGKDRGKDVESAPWYHVFGGDRINDHHLSLDEKRRVQEKLSTENTESTEKGER